MWYRVLSCLDRVLRAAARIIGYIQNSAMSPDYLVVLHWRPQR